MCKLNYEICNCGECQNVKNLYEQFEWFEQDREFNQEIIRELENKIESMGYFI